MNKVLPILALVVLASCSPQRRLARLLERFPPDTTSTTTVVYRDSIIERQIPGDTVYDEKEIPVPYLDTDSIAKLWKLNSTQKELIDDLNRELARSTYAPPIYNETTFARSKAWIEDGILKSELHQKDSVLQDTIKNAIKESETVKEIPYPVIQKVGKFWKHGFLILAGLILVGMLLWFLFRKR